MKQKLLATTVAFLLLASIAIIFVPQAKAMATSSDSVTATTLNNSKYGPASIYYNSQPTDYGGGNITLGMNVEIDTSKITDSNYPKVVLDDPNNPGASQFVFATVYNSGTNTWELTYTQINSRVVTCQSQVNIGNSLSNAIVYITFGYNSSAGGTPSTYVTCNGQVLADNSESYMGVGLWTVETASNSTFPTGFFTSGTYTIEIQSQPTLDLYEGYGTTSADSGSPWEGYGNQIGHLSYTAFLGEQVPVTAYDSDYTTFVNWVLDGVNYNGNSITVNMNSDHNLTAVFNYKIQAMIGDPFLYPTTNPEVETFLDTNAKGKPDQILTFGGYTYVRMADRILKVDNSDMHLVGTFIPPVDGWGYQEVPVQMATDGSYLYCSFDVQDYLTPNPVFKIDPATLTIIGNASLPRGGTAQYPLVCADGYVYAGDFQYVLKLDPSTMSLVANYTSPNNILIQKMARSDGGSTIALDIIDLDNGGVNVLRTLDPVTMELSSASYTLNPTQSIQSMIFSGNYIYLGETAQIEKVSASTLTLASTWVEPSSIDDISTLYMSSNGHLYAGLTPDAPNTIFYVVDSSSMGTMASYGSETAQSVSMFTAPFSVPLSYNGGNQNNPINNPTPSPEPTNNPTSAPTSTSSGSSGSGGIPSWLSQPINSFIASVGMLVPAPIRNAWANLSTVAQEGITAMLFLMLVVLVAAGVERTKRK